jgi:hypothetical protein
MPQSWALCTHEADYCPLGPKALLLSSHEADTCPLEQIVWWLFTWYRQLSLMPQSWALSTHEADYCPLDPKALLLSSHESDTCPIEQTVWWLFTWYRQLSLMPQNLSLCTHEADYRPLDPKLYYSVHTLKHTIVPPTPDFHDCSRDADSYPYSESHYSNLLPYVPVIFRLILMLSYFLRLDFISIFFPSDSDQPFLPLFYCLMFPSILFFSKYSSLYHFVNNKIINSLIIYCLHFPLFLFLTSRITLFYALHIKEQVYCLIAHYKFFYQYSICLNMIHWSLRTLNCTTTTVIGCNACPLQDHNWLLVSEDQMQSQGTSSGVCGGYITRGTFSLDCIGFKYYLLFRQVFCCTYPLPED